MKKIIAILLLCVYFLSTLGLSLKSFYCCGNLESVSVGISQEEQQTCANDNNMGDCCQTKFQFFKIKDNYVACDAINTPVLHFTYLHLFTPSSGVTGNTSWEVHDANQSNAPPLHHTVPDYIFNCVFRV